MNDILWNLVTTHSTHVNDMEFMKLVNSCRSEKRIELVSILQKYLGNFLVYHLIEKLERNVFEISLNVKINPEDLYMSDWIEVTSDKTTHVFNFQHTELFCTKPHGSKTKKGGKVNINLGGLVLELKTSTGHNGVVQRANHWSKQINDIHVEVFVPNRTSQGAIMRNSKDMLTLQIADYNYVLRVSSDNEITLLSKTIPVEHDVADLLTPVEHDVADLLTSLKYMSR